MYQPVGKIIIEIQKMTYYEMNDGTWRCGDTCRLTNRLSTFYFLGECTETTLFVKRWKGRFSMAQEERPEGLIMNATKPVAVADAENVDDIIKILDDYTVAGGGRMKLNVVDGEGKTISKQYHHGRCDVGSPWAKGQAFDVLE